MSNTTSLANGSQSGALDFIPVHINLPPEIRYNIVGSIRYNRSKPDFILDLFSCCIASKQWRDAAVPFLKNVFEYLDFDDWREDCQILELVQRISQMLDVSPETLMCCVTAEIRFTIPPSKDIDGILRTHNFDEALLDIIHTLPGLKTIIISMEDSPSNTSLRDVDWENIYQYLERIPAVARNKITELTASEFCSFERLFSRGFSLFQPIFADMPKLRKVQLNGLSYIEVDAFKAISEGSPHIEILELSLNTNSDIPLKDFVGAWPGLRVLKFDGDEITYAPGPDYVTRELMNKLADNCHKLEEFIAPQKFLRENDDDSDDDDDDEEEILYFGQPLSPTWENSLFRMILCCPNICKLDLTNRNISDTTLTILVTRVPLLENLKLRCCIHLTGEPLFAIAATWVQINLLHLEFLDLRGCHRLKPAAIQLLASSAPSLKVLKLPSTLNNHAGLAAHFETALSLLQDEDENPCIETRRWVKPHVAEERRNAQERRNAEQRPTRAEREKEEENGNSISELHEYIEYRHRFD